MNTALTAKEIQEPILRPSRLASRSREGKLPAMRPRNREIARTAWALNKSSSSLANSQNPASQPMTTGRKMRQAVRKAFLGWASSSIRGWYSPNRTQSTPPLMPGRIAPLPMMSPCSTRRRGEVLFCMVGLT